MARLQSFLSGIRAFFGKDQRSLEMDEELRAYLEAAAQDKMRGGMSYPEALRAARVEMGSMETVKQKVRSVGWESVAERLWHDVRYSLRMMLKSLGFTAVAIISLALGIGANTAIFTLINDLLFKSLSVRDPQQLVSFGKAVGGGEMDGIEAGALDIFTYDFYQRLEHEQAQGHTPFTGICAFGSFWNQVSVRIGSGENGATTQAAGQLVSGNFFSVLGAEPLLGRTLAPSDANAPGSSPVAVISYRYWQQVFAGDPAIIGRSITINGTLFTVIGVMPTKFDGVTVNKESMDMWLPVTMQQEVMLQPTLLAPGGLFWMHLMARRDPAVPLGQAQAWVTNQVQRFMTDREGAQITPERKKEIQKIYVDLLPGDRGISDLREIYQQPLNILMGVVMLVLLIACANLANFLLAKAASREREIATRLALGSSRRRIVRQILMEALLLSFTGGALGLALAYLGTRALIGFVAEGAKHTPLEARPDLHVLLFTLGVSFLTGILFGIAPALRVSRISVAPSLGTSVRTDASSGGSSGRFLPKLLVVSQVTLSLVLLASAGLFLRTLRNLENQDLGFNRHNLLLVKFNAKFAGYKPEQLNAMYARLMERMNALPGVRSATFSGQPALIQGNWNSPIRIRGYQAAPNEDLGTSLNRVGPRYFETIGMPIIQGRPIGEQDTASSVKAVVVNQTLADHFFPRGDAIGHTFTVDDPSVKDEWQIVGVVRDAKYHSPREKPERMTYLAVTQLTGDDAYAYWLQLSTVGDPAKVAGEVRAAMAEIDPNLPILEVRTIAEQVDQSMGQEQLISQLSGFFSLLALSLACIGLYGVMTYNVVRRTNEIGIRLALGAQTGRVLWMVLRESLMLLGIGVALGIPLTLGAGHAVRSMLFGLSPSDPFTLAGAIAVIAAVTVLAAYLPARRATKVDPMVALRYE
ncbi:MAG TPA: ABC transporter permease [Silvibacterium sp.]|nr:ABC transporter permease [Silvibacterium sp.]